MSDSDRHINFKLMRDHILALQDGETPRAGKKYWRSLDELADSPVFREFVAREFPQQAESWHDPIERRTFMKLMGASLALAGLTWLRLSTAGEDRSLRQSAGRSRSRQSAFLCDCRSTFWRGHSDPRAKQRRTADKDRRQSGSSKQPARRFSAGGSISRSAWLERY